MHAQSLSRVRLLKTPGFSVHGISQGVLPFPSPGDLPHPRTEPASPALSGKLFTTKPLGKRKGSERQ